MQQQMAREIQGAQPQFIIQVRTWTSWLARPAGLDSIDKLCERLMPPHYKLVGSCDVFPDQSRVQWDWQPDPATDVTALSKEILVFERMAHDGEKAQR
jgi:hypothetical protein